MSHNTSHRRRALARRRSVEQLEAKAKPKPKPKSSTKTKTKADEAE